MKTAITVIGLPGSGKTTIADLIHKRIGGARVNADTVRSSVSLDLKFADLDRELQAWRMGSIAALALAEPVTVVCGRDIWHLNQFVTVDFVNPTESTRSAYNWALCNSVIPIRKYTLWMDTISASACRFPDTAKLFQPPKEVSKHVEGFKTSSELEELASEIVREVRHL